MRSSFLESLHTDFTAAYMIVREINEGIRSDPKAVRPETLEILERILRGREHAGQSKALFLYRECAQGLADIMAAGNGLADRAYSVLKNIAVGIISDPCLAASEAMGSLPFSLTPPRVDIDPTPLPVPAVFWKDITRVGSIQEQKWSWSGRTLLVRDNNRILALKCLKPGEPRLSLSLEGFWMDHLQGRFPEKTFSVPCPLFSDQGYLVRPTDGPARGKIALAYTAPASYFIYPNAPDRLMEPDEFLETMSRCAGLFGSLAGNGMLHTAPIPLFHNRVQQARRDDLGIYLWQRMGRLDRWLDSCCHPNFGLSGIRDLEHLETRTRSGRQLFRDMGAQILSLILVAGSYFRARNPALRGQMKDGTPVDARHLFDAELLQQAVEGIVRSYYFGFVGKPLKDSLPGVHGLVQRMIEEMGIDRYMEEIVRIPDQEEMDENAFYGLLASGGMNQSQLMSVRKGEQEITLMTGPHLGAFNGSISLPELPLFVAGTAALCTAARFLEEHKNHQALQQP